MICDWIGIHKGRWQGIVLNCTKVGKLETFLVMDKTKNTLKNHHELEDKSEKLH